jgi:hypothetical protein
MSVFKGWLAAIAAAVTLLAPAMAEAKWLRAETDRFIVYSDGSEMALREYAVKLEDFDTVLRAFFNLDPAGVPARKLEIYLVNDTVELKRVSPGASESLRGFYFASPETLFAIAIRTRGKGDEDDVILHEYAHHFMMQYLAGSYPGWLIEGFAEYYMTAKLKAGSFEIGDFNTGRAYTLMNGEWTATETVLTKRTGELRRDEVFGYYAQSWLMTHYMLSDPNRRKQLFTYVRLLGEGNESVAAWKEATGEELAAFDAKLKIYMKRGVPSTKFTRPNYKPATVAITTLPPSADALLLENLRVTMGRISRPDPEADDQKREKEYQAFIDKVRGRAASFPNDALAQRTLALVEIKAGDKAAGMAILDRLIAADPNDATALRIKAVTLMDDARELTEVGARGAMMKDAARLLLRANKAEPDEYRTLFNYALTRRGDRDYPNDNIIDVLGNAVALAPQVDEIRIESARALMLRKRYDEARVLLLPVANDPHGGAAAEVAKGLLRQLEMGR